MINPAVFIGAPLHSKEGYVAYPPSIREMVSNPHFGQYKKILTISHDEIAYELREQLKQNPELVAPDPITFVLANSYNNKMFEELAYQAFEFFTHQKVEFDYENKTIIIKGDKDLILNETNYLDFQNFIREACGEPPEKAPEPEDPNEDPRIRRIKQKAKERDMIKKLKGGQNGGVSFDMILVAICCMGIGLTPLNIGEMSYAAVPTLMKVYQEKEKYDLDVRSLLAGADSKKIKPKYWIRNLD